MLRIIQKGKMGESLLIAVLLAVVGGFLDIYTYLARGKVFANTQTGNLVLLGYNIAKGDSTKIVYYVLPLLAFSLGVVLTKSVEYYYREVEEFSWIDISILIEMGVLVIVALIPNGFFNIVANVLVSFACGLQVQAFRKVNGVSYSTTMFTGNLKNAVERLTHYVITREKEALENGIVYSAVIIAFIFGAYLGDRFIQRFQERAVLFGDGLLGIVFILLYIEKRRRFVQ